MITSENFMLENMTSRRGECVILVYLIYNNKLTRPAEVINDGLDADKTAAADKADELIELVLVAKAAALCASSNC